MPLLGVALKVECGGEADLGNGVEVMVEMEKEVGGKNEGRKWCGSNSRWHEYLMNEHIMGFKGAVEKFGKGY